MLDHNRYMYMQLRYARKKVDILRGYRVWDDDCCGSFSIHTESKAGTAYGIWVRMLTATGAFFPSQIVRTRVNASQCFSNKRETEVGTIWDFNTNCTDIRDKD